MRNSKRGSSKRILNPLVLPKDLECGLLHGMMQGVIAHDVVDREELSREGQFIWDALESLRSAKPPITSKAVLSAAVDVLGKDKAEIQDILNDVVKQKIGAEGSILVQSLRNKRALNELINEAGAQLATGELDTAALLTTLDMKQFGKLTPASDFLKDGIPDDPTGVTVPWPSIQKASGGLFGMWALGGEPGAGKSTLALQLASIYAATEGPVLYYDFENGVNVMLNHLGHAYGKRDHQLINLCQRLYFRDSIKTLAEDLSALKSPAFVVVDSIQKLPTSDQYRRVGLDRWIVKFEALKKQGHTVLLLSEKNRGSYGSANLGGFKETSEVEYSADLGAQLVEVDEGVIEFHVVKNRHRPKKGLIATLVWNDWMYEEEKSGSEPVDQRNNAYQD